MIKISLETLHKLSTCDALTLLNLCNRNNIELTLCVEQINDKGNINGRNKQNDTSEIATMDS